MLLLAIDFDNLHQILQNLYVEMMPLCSKMTGVARGLAGLGALFYVAYRVWQALARAEPVDVFPLLRPFALGLCIMFFPTLVLGTLIFSSRRRHTRFTRVTGVQTCALPISCVLHRCRLLLTFTSSK